MEIDRFRQYLNDYDGFKPVTNMNDSDLVYLYDAVYDYVCKQQARSTKARLLLQIHGQFNCDTLLKVLRDLPCDEVLEIHAAITARLSDE